MFNIEEHVFEEERILSLMVFGDLKFDKIKRKWVQKPLDDKKVERVPIVLDVCGESWTMLGSKAHTPTAQVKIDGVADTGCSILCSGVDICSKFKIKPSLQPASKLKLHVADGCQLTVLGYLPFNISVKGSGHRTEKILIAHCAGAKGRVHW